jgi:hypothetical protein
MSFEVILPFLRPIEHLILDGDISEIMVNGSSRVFIERRGRLEEVPGVAIEEKMLQVAIKNIARRLGDEINGRHTFTACSGPAQRSDGAPEKHPRQWWDFDRKDHHAERSRYIHRSVGPNRVD